MKKTEPIVRKSSDMQFEEKPSILTIKNEWNTHSNLGLRGNIQKIDITKIKNFMNSLLIPSWYRGISIFQKRSADNLLYAIRDDLAQKTVHRTMNCLISIGLDPLPSKKQLHTILQLCGGSDLVLLWFLMEWLYIDDQSDTYSVNEQLIISTIAYLDTDSTLRELNRILPPPNKPKIKEKEQKTKKSSKSNKENVKLRKESNFPYFQKLTHPPRAPKKVSYKVKHQDFKRTESCNLHLLSKNSPTRWYNDIEQNGDPETIRNLALQEIISKIRNSEAITVEDNFVAEIDSKNNKYIELVRNSWYSSVEQITNNEVQKSRSSQDTINRLQSSYQKQLQQVYSLAETYTKHRRISDLSKLSPGERGKQSIETSEMRKNVKHRSSNIIDFLSDQERRKSSISTKMQNGVNRGRSNLADLLSDQERNENTESSEMQKGVNIGILADNSNQNEVFVSTKSSSENDFESNFFVAPQNRQYFKFDYNKIFNFENSETALNSNISLTSLEEKTPQNYLNKWKTEVVKHGINIEFAGGDSNTNSESILDYGLDYYDPNDDELMDRMLKDALDIMKNDSRFVLASIPSSHRFPLLRDWIRLRYGKRYTEEEMERDYQKCIPIFVALTKVGLPVETPSNNDIGTNLQMDYSCRDYIKRKSNYIRDKYYKRINNALLAQSRIMHAAVRQPLCGYGTPCQTMFAYMPSHNRASYNFRPWKSDENMSKKISLTPWFVTKASNTL